jgi:hypothetical protein
MDAAKTITATFNYNGCSTRNVKNADTLAYYDTVQSGYSLAENNHAILMHEGIFIEDLLLNKTNAVTLKGGYDCNYDNNSGIYTALKGTVTIKGNTVTMENLIISNLNGMQVRPRNHSAHFACNMAS